MRRTRRTVSQVRTAAGFRVNERLVSWRPSAFYWVHCRKCVNADGAREKPRGALATFYLWNVPKCVPGHVPEDRQFSEVPSMDASRATLVFDGNCAICRSWVSYCSG